MLLREAGLDIDSLAARLAVHTELADRIAQLRGSRKKRFFQEPVRDSRVAESVLVADKIESGTTSGIQNESTGAG